MANDCPAFLKNMVETLPAKGHFDTDCEAKALNTILNEILWAWRKHFTGFCNNFCNNGSES